MAGTGKRKKRNVHSYSARKCELDIYLKDIELDTFCRDDILFVSETFSVEDVAMQCSFCLRYKERDEMNETFQQNDETFQLWLRSTTSGQLVYKTFRTYITGSYQNSYVYSNKPSGEYLILDKINPDSLFLEGDDNDLEYRGVVTIRWIHNAKLAEKERPLSMSRHFEWLLESNEFSDMVIETQNGTRFPVHQAILAVMSPVFRAMMLTTDVCKSKRKGIKISDFSDDTIKAMITFMYVGYRQKFEFEQAVELLKIADKYDLADLQFHCVTDLLAEIDYSNVFELLLLGENYSDELLKSEALFFIADNQRELCQAERLASLQLSQHLLTEISITTANLKKHFKLHFEV